MSFLFRSLTRLSLRQTIRPTAVAPTFARTFTTKPIAFNQQPTTTTTPTSAPEAEQKQKQLPDLSPLKLSNELYAVVRVHGNPFLVTEGDIMNLPYHLKTADVGDVLHFTDVTTIGTRNFTYANEPVDPRLVSIKAVVIEKTKNPMTIKEVTKRRNRRVRHAISKRHKTRLRVTEIKLN
ncbi:unnamed protein product [Wickerhamomyces anomalus]